VPQDESLDLVGAIISLGQDKLHPVGDTGVFAMAELFNRFVSPDAPLTVAVLVIVEPAGAFTLTTRVIALCAPEVSGPSEQDTTPVPPTGGLLQLPGLVSDTKVVPAGIKSVNVTPVSVLGPLLVTTIA
jgi:hypothetical protein